MGFALAPVASRRCASVCTSKGLLAIVAEKLLDKLAEHALKHGEFGGVEDVEYGCSGGRHIFDGQFTFDRNVFNDAIAFALRIDTNKVPGEVKKAYEIMEEDAAAANNPSG